MQGPNKSSRVSMGAIARRLGMTLLEMVIAMAIVVVILTAILPAFRSIRNSWDAKQAAAETLQNSRVLIDHLNYNLSKAVRITDVSDSNETSGYIQFEGNDGNDWRYEIGDSNLVEFGIVGSLSDLAGPVSQLQFTCYDGNDFNNPTTDVNSIRFVDVNATLTNSAALGQDKFFTTSVYLRTGQEGSSDCGLVGWWKLDETSGLTAADSSGNGNDGTLTNMAGNEWTDGVVSGALELDGFNDYIVRSSTSSLNLPTAWTIAVWVYFVGSPSYEYIVTRNTSSTSNMQYGIYVRTPASGGAVGAVFNGAITDISPVSWSMGTWTHIAVTWDGSDALAYVDGAFVDSVSYSGTLTDQGNWFNIGRRSNSVDGTFSTGLFDGFIDDVRVYNRALEPDEIAQLASVLRYEDFTEAKVSSDANSITITTPDTNQGDLLIAAVATDGDTSSSLAPPGGEGWTEIDINDYSNDVTLGAWWKLAGASEPNHTFTWSGSEQAYGWMMRFAGHDSTNPINAHSADGELSDTPTSPAVTATVDNCLILRLGAFDDDDITEDDPGLSGHTAITMDESSQGTTCWQNQDVGSVAAAGSASFAGGTWTIEGSGYDIMFNTDEFHYVYQPLSDDGQIIARVASIENTNFLAKAGVMIRETLNGSSKYAGIFVTPNYGVYFQYRTSTGGNTSFTSGSSSHAPRWFKVTRSGSTFRGYESANGSTWTQVGSSVSISMDSDIYIGLAVCSHYDGVLCTAEFDNVTAPCVAAGGTVSGGAGYVMQSASGGSGTSTFSLGSSNEAQMLTIAIAPNSNAGCTGSGGIQP